MNVLAFLGSPKRGGNSEVLLEAMLKGITAAGGTAEIIRLSRLKISPCLNCGGCDEAGICVIKDDMQPLYDKITNTNLIVLSSPIYFYGITAQAKAFVDRCQALWNRKRILREKKEWKQNPNRRGFFLSVAATQGKMVFNGAVLTMKYAYDAMDYIYDGELLVRGVDKVGEMAQTSQALIDAEEAGRKFFTGES